MRAVVTLSFLPGKSMEIELPDDWASFTEEDRANFIGDEAEDLVWDSTEFHVTVINASDEEQ